MFLPRKDRDLVMWRKSDVLRPIYYCVQCSSCICKAISVYHCFDICTFSEFRVWWRLKQLKSCAAFYNETAVYWTSFTQVFYGVVKSELTCRPRPVISTLHAIWIWLHVGSNPAGATLVLGLIIIGQVIHLLKPFILVRNARPHYHHHHYYGVLLKSNPHWYSHCSLWMVAVWCWCAMKRAV